MTDEAYHIQIIIDQERQDENAQPFLFVGWVITSITHRRWNSSLEQYSASEFCHAYYIVVRRRNRRVVGSNDEICFRASDLLNTTKDMKF